MFSGINVALAVNFRRTLLDRGWPDWVNSSANGGSGEAPGRSAIGASMTSSVVAGYVCFQEAAKVISPAEIEALPPGSLGRESPLWVEFGG
ncbi:hypothetical protein [Mesorhizobium onobrychidis]|uniref:Uncharacterized protein n=1 Tax=Mesorhizobium onobrychidis TaxID=2775404 RepID=A0ABY5QUD4_9HYPH|nr:hypothetical protein [Mesorhizobium onobrychidis]UVC14289.1 hypothetical protein IHQ72_27095 [Mesorhizobium onobrychidis]